MNCQKVKRWLPLSVGKDLPLSRMRAVDRHLARCPWCREDYERLKLALEQTKEWLSADAADWKEPEWQDIIRKAREVGKKSTVRQSVVPILAPWPFRKVWAYSLMAAAGLILSWLIWGPSIRMRETSVRAEAPLQQQKSIQMAAQQEIPQDIVSMTLISKETGLKINWFFNKNFKWEEKK